MKSNNPTTATITNISKQMIPLAIAPPNGDFYVHGQSVYLSPGRATQLPISYLNEDQISNLQKARRITRRDS